MGKSPGPEALARFMNFMVAHGAQVGMVHYKSPSARWGSRGLLRDHPWRLGSSLWCAARLSSSSGRKAENSRHCGTGTHAPDSVCSVVRSRGKRLPATVWALLLPGCCSPHPSQRLVPPFYGHRPHKPGGEKQDEGQLCKTEIIQNHIIYFTWARNRLSCHWKRHSKVLETDTLGGNLLPFAAVSTSGGNQQALLSPP